MKNNLIYVLFLILSNLTYGQTNVSGGIFNDTTWNVNGSPYVITSDVALFPGYSLTIEPGVTIKFNSGTKLILRGTLNALGTSDNKITFTSNLDNPKKGDWVGIKLENNQGGIILASNIVGEYSDMFIEIMNSSSGEIINISNSEIRHSNYGFYGYEGSSFSHKITLNNLNVNNCTNGYRHARNVTINNSFFSQGVRGIMCSDQNSNINILNTEISYYSLYGTYLQGGATIDNCNINNNETGINLLKDLIVKNSNIRFNTYGLSNWSSYQYSGENVFDNTICDNTQYNLRHTASYTVTLGANCWCTNNESEISQTIFDAYDDVSSGIVTFTPFNNCSNSLDIQDYSSVNDNFYFYPNPANNEIILSDNSIKYFEIYSINGVIIKQGQVNKKVNISDLNKGFYLIKLFNLNKSEFSIKKLIIE